MHSRAAAPAALLTLALLATAPAASADTYTVLGCRTVAGAPVPAAGWTTGALGGATAGDTCASGGALTAALGTLPPGGSAARIRFDAPPATRIVRVAAARRTANVGTSDQALDAAYELSTDTGAILEKCQVAADSACTADLVEPLDRQGIDAGALRFSVVCAKGGDEQCTRAVGLTIDRIAVGLRDTSVPTVAGVVVADDGDTSGRLRLRFDAADAGGGTYRALVRVDGQVVDAVPLGGETCRDADPADADPYVFLAPVPCPPLAQGVPVEVDAGRLAAGPHTIQVDVEDAAGNAVAAYVTQFPRPNATGGASTPGQVQRLLNGRLEARFVKSGGSRLTSRFGERVVVRGRLVDRRTGKGIRGARIDVTHYVGAKGRAKGKTGLKTREGGRLTLILPRDLDTRRVRLAYRALRPGPVTSSRQLRLTVRDRRGRLVRTAR